MPLRCDVDVDAWRANNRAPLFPGRYNRWLMTFRSGTTQVAEPSAGLEPVRVAFSRWLPFFGTRKVEEPEHLEEDPQVAPVATLGQLAEPPTLRPTQSRIFVEFFLGDDANESMPWPTLVNQRRARIDPLCPLVVEGVDVTALEILPPSDASPPIFEPDAVPPFEERTGVRDPLDFGIRLPPPTPKNLGLLAAGLAVGGVGIAVAVYALRRKAAR